MLGGIGDPVDVETTRTIEVRRFQERVLKSHVRIFNTSDRSS